MITRSLTARLAASAIAAGVLLTTAAGCSLIAPPGTYLSYDPADGVSADLGDVQLRDVLGVLSEDGASLALVFTAINTGSSSAQVTIAADDAEATVNVSSDSAVSVGRTDDSAEVVLAVPADVVPGSLVEVYAQSGTADGVLMSVPVFDVTNPLYADYVPAAPTPTPAPADDAAETDGVGDEGSGSADG